ncbi:hypothetical protein [Pseudomonas sp. UM16]|uniref:hypothetical protein n=1 Tax=Pseudomonas sp. UM16 TaxID=3158962 RepID=UPI00398FCC11
MNDFIATFEKTFHVQKTWALASTLTHVYAEMAEEAYSLYLKDHHNRVPEPPADGYSAKRVEQDHRMTQHGIKSIVFTAMALESSVFELATINLGDKAASALDKANLDGKWRIVPQMICGQSLSEEPVLNELHALNKARNKLVHHKSEILPGYRPLPGYEGGVDAESNPQWTEESIEAVDKAFSAMNARSERFHTAVRASFKTLVRVSLELESLIGHAGPLPRFSTGASSSGLRRSKLLKNAISECKTGFGKKHKKAGSVVSQ